MSTVDPGVRPSASRSGVGTTIRPTESIVNSIGNSLRILSRFPKGSVLSRPGGRYRVASTTQSLVVDAEGRGGGSDCWSVISVPDAQWPSQALSCRNRLGAKGGDSVCLGDLRHPVSDQTHRHNENPVWELDESLTKRTASLMGPVSRQPTTPCRYDALAEPDEIKIRGREVILACHTIELLAGIICNQITEEMIVDDCVGHVVARSGSSDSDATKTACSSRLSRSPRRRLASPAGTVSTPNPKSTTSTGPPWASCQRRRTAAGRDICPDAETKNCWTDSTRTIILGAEVRRTKCPRCLERPQPGVDPCHQRQNNGSVPVPG